jgi:ribonuclease PH
VQGTAEGAPFSESEFLALMALARHGITALMELQRQATA